MSRLSQVFAKKKRRVLNMYCTAGFPHLHSTMDVMKALQDGGADIIELGMPYSDPLADGPVIQHSSSVALSNGMTLSVLFDQLPNLRNEIHLPVILMGYLNPLLQYGFEKFCAQAAAAGIDGLIIPDIPAHEFEQEYKAIIEKHGLDFIFLVTPETGEERVKKLDRLSSGFLYAVSSSSITGSARSFDSVAQYLQKLQALHLKNPVLVGFGVKDKSSFDAVTAYSNGAIIGSAYIAMLQNSTNLHVDTKTFIQNIVGSEADTD